MQLLNTLAQVPIPLPDSTAVKGIKSVGDSIAALTPAKMATSIKDLDWSEVLTSLSSTMVSFTLRIIAAILIFYVGKLIINKLHRVLHNTMVKREWDLSLGSFLLSMFKFVMLFLLIITVIGVLGIETSSFIALFASAGVAIGMALSGTLQNFAGGVVILLLKPYKIGDFIEFGTFKGCVKEIQIFHTILTTYNNERIIIPNGGISTGTINNLSTERFRRVEWRVSISYGDSVELARKVALEIIADEKRIVNNEIAKRDLPVGSILLEKNYEPSVNLESLDDSAVVIVVRAWTAFNDYWGVLYAVNERIYEEFPKRGLHFPFPQLDVHFDQQPAS